MKNQIIQMLCEMTRLYFRQSWAPGRTWLWNNWVRRYLLWRPLTFVTRTLFGTKMFATFPDVIQAHIYFFGVWEPTITTYIRSNLRSGDVFIDIGANVGYHSLLASESVGARGRVFAFEASPAIYLLLQKNLEINPTANVVAQNVAVGEECCQLPIFLGQEGYLAQSTTVHQVAAKVDATFETTVSCYPLGDLLDAETFSSIRLIKIDVEGAELLVARGLQPILGSLSNDTEILIEINSEAAEEMGGTAKEIFDIFESAGFSAFEIHNSYEVAFYIKPEKLALVPYNGEAFKQKDFVLKRLKTSKLLENHAVI